MLKKNPGTTMALLVWLFCFFPGVAWAEMIDDVPDRIGIETASRDPVFHEFAVRGIRLVMNDQYRESIVLFDLLERLYPKHPAPHFLKSAALQHWMGSYRIKTFQDELEENVQCAIDEGNALLSENQDPWLYFYVGAAYGYRAFNRFRKHNWIGAYLDGKKGINHLHEALKRDPHIYDVYLGLGTYHYWRTAKSGFIRAIAFWIPDKRELGLNQLEFSSEHGQYSSDESNYALITAYFDHGDYEKSHEVLNRILSVRKPTLMDLYYQGRLFIKFQRWEEAESLFLNLLRRLEESEMAAVGYQAECKYWISLAMKEQNKTAVALELAQEAMALSETRNPEMELEGPFENFKEIHYQMKNLCWDLKGQGEYANAGKALPVKIFPH
jgi:tetratricopeptide (TPR) repeat protein